MHHSFVFQAYILFTETDSKSTLIVFSVHTPNIIYKHLDIYSLALSRFITKTIYNSQTIKRYFVNYDNVYTNITILFITL